MAIDRDNPDPAENTAARVAARRAEAAALTAAEFACEAYTATLAEPEQTEVRPDHELPVAGGEPERPLASAVADLGATAYAAARAVHLTLEDGRLSAMHSAARAAEAAAQAAKLGVDALLAEGGPQGPAFCQQLAHASALTAQLAAEALAPYPPPPQRQLLMGDPHHHLQVAFPASWKRLTDELSRRLGETPSTARDEPLPATGTPEALWRAACVARDAADLCRRAHGRCGAESPAARASLRAARIAALASTYTGWAALQAAPVAAAH